jgi:hypothetical protein
MPELMGYAFARFPMWPKLKAAASALPSDLTILTGTEILDARPQQVRIPVLVGSWAKSPEALKGGGPEGRQHHSYLHHQVPGGADPQPRRRPGRGDDEGVFRLICRFSPTPFDR